MEISLGGLDEIIKDIYYTHGRLEKVVESTRSLIEKSKVTKDGEEDDDLAVPRLSAGGIIAISRTLEKLEGHLSAYKALELP